MYIEILGVSDFKIFMFENSENKAQMNEKVPTDFSVKLRVVRVRILFDIPESLRNKNRNRC